MQLKLGDTGAAVVHDPDVYPALSDTPWLRSNRIRSHQETIACLELCCSASNYSANGETDRSTERGARAFIQKPYEVQPMLKMVARCWTKTDRGTHVHKDGNISKRNSSPILS